MYTVCVCVCVCLHRMGMCEHECMGMSAVMCLSRHTYGDQRTASHVCPDLVWDRFLLFATVQAKLSVLEASRDCPIFTFCLPIGVHWDCRHRTAQPAFMLVLGGSNSGLLSCTASNKFIFLAQYLLFYPFPSPIWIALVFFIPIFLFDHQLEFSSFILYMNGASIGPHLMWASNKGCINVQFLVLF